VENSTIFIVVASGGEYDDAWQSNLFAFRNEEDAKEQVAKLTAQNEFANSIRPKIVQIYSDALLMPIDHLEEQDAHPKGPRKPTKQSLAEYNVKVAEWTAKNEPIAQRNLLRTEARRLLAAAAARKHAIDLGATDEHLDAIGFTETDFDLYHHCDITYEYAEIQLL
jgi:hypothetical protein